MAPSNRSTRAVRFYCTPEEYAVLRQRATQAGYSSLSAYVYDVLTDTFATPDSPHGKEDTIHGASHDPR